MKYKQLTPEIVVRAEDGAKIAIDDPDYLAWLADGNSPFPPDPPAAAELEKIVEELSEE